MKTCKLCGVTGEVGVEFHSYGGLVCKKCRTARDTERRIKIQNEGGEAHERRKAAMRIANAVRRFEITHDEARRLYDTVGCRICGGANDSGRRLNIDHNHATGRVRGVLCNRCNRGLGFFKDDPQLLLLAIAYLNETDIVPE